MRFSPGCHCCKERACCNCAAQNRFWKFTWPTLGDPFSTGICNQPPAGEIVLEMANCSTVSGSEPFANFTRWESAESFAYTSPSAGVHPYFTLHCGADALEGPQRFYSLRAWFLNGSGAAQVFAEYRLNIAAGPSSAECLGPIDLAAVDLSTGGCTGYTDPLTLEAP